MKNGIFICLVLQGCLSERADNHNTVTGCDSIVLDHVSKTRLKTIDFSDHSIYPKYYGISNVILNNCTYDTIYLGLFKLEDSVYTMRPSKVISYEIGNGIQKEKDGFLIYTGRPDSILKISKGEIENLIVLGKSYSIDGIIYEYLYGFDADSASQRISRYFHYTTKAIKGN